MNGLMALRILEKMDRDELEKCSVRLFDSEWVKEVVGDFQMFLKDGDRRIELEQGENAFQELKKLYLDKIRDITDCRWWIDNRAETVRRVFRELFSDWLQS